MYSTCVDSYDELKLTAKAELEAQQLKVVRMRMPFMQFLVQQTLPMV